MLKCDTAKLQEAIMHEEADKLLSTMKSYNVNPKTIKRIAVIDGFTIFNISGKLYASSALASGYDGAGPFALEELLKWCGCENPKIYDAIKKEARVNLFINPQNHWDIVYPTDDKL